MALPAQRAQAESVTKVLTSLERRSREIGRAMSKATRERVPEIARAAALDSDLSARLDMMCAEHVRAFAHSASSTSRPDESQFGFVRQLGVRRSRDLFPLEALMHGVRAGHQVLWNEIVAEAGPSIEGQSAALALTERLIHYTDAVGHALERSYLDEQQSLAADRALARQALLDDLLSGHLFSRPEGPRRAFAAGFEADADYLVAALGVGQATSTDAADALCSALERLAFARRGWPFTARRGDDVIAVMASAQVDDARKLVRSAATTVTIPDAGPVVAGIGGPCRGVAALPGACEAALLALRHARRGGDVVHLDELRLIDYLVDGADPTARRLGLRRSRPLAEEEQRRGSSLIETFATYIDCDINVARTAGVLGLHPNTIRHRLSRIETLTGLDTRCIRDVIELAAAVEMLRAHRKMEELI